MENYYNILNITNTASMEDITIAYKNHIERYKGLPFLTESMKEEVKKYKKALYILSDYHKRKSYDNYLENNKDISKFNYPSRKIEYNERDFDPRQFHFSSSDYIDDTKINDRIFGNIFNKKV